MKPGEKLQEGIVVSHDAKGVLVGRAAQPGESLPPRHTEHYFGEVRVFLSDDQAYILPAGLHPVKATRAPAKASAKPKRKGK